MLLENSPPHQLLDEVYNFILTPVSSKNYSPLTLSNTLPSHLLSGRQQFSD